MLFIQYVFKIYLNIAAKGQTLNSSVFTSLLSIVYFNSISVSNWKW